MSFGQFIINILIAVFCGFCVAIASDTKKNSNGNSQVETFTATAVIVFFFITVYSCAG